MPPSTGFIVGATGFVGGHLLADLATAYAHLRLRCLVRTVAAERVAALRELNSNVEIVEGTLEDTAIIVSEAAKADIAINVASSDHMSSVEAILAGLQQQFEQDRDCSPAYLHMSGLGVIADNVRGEKVDCVKEWTDLAFSLENCPPENPHLNCDRKIISARTASGGRIRAHILFPGLIYGFGRGSATSAWVRLFSSLARAAGHAGTWGPGEVSQYCVHVKDVSQAVVCILKHAIESQTEDQARHNLFFVASQEPTMSWKQINEVLAEIMFAKGLIATSEVKAFSAPVIARLGEFGWSLFGSNGHARADHLAQLGWKADWTKKEPLAGVITGMVEAGL